MIELPKFAANTGAELLSGEYENLRADYDGTVTLASRNEMPDPTLEDRVGGKLPRWTLIATPAASSWNAYARQHSELVNGSHRKVEGSQMLRQNFTRLPWERQFHEIKLPLIDGAPLPNASRYSDIAAPQEPPRVRVLNVTGGLGFPAGNYWVSYAGIIGNPVTSMLITSAAPPVQISVAQGQKIEIPIPQEIPANFHGLLWLMSPVNGSYDDLRAQERQDIRVRFRDSKILAGPWRNSKRRWRPAGHPQAENWTYVAGANEFGPPERKYLPTGLETLPMDLGLSYRFVTNNGITASQSIRRIHIENSLPGRKLSWRPRARPEGAKAWIPEFSGADGKWYTLAHAANGIPLGAWAGIWTNDPKRKRFKHPGQRAKVLKRQAFDRSGVTPPDEAIEFPETEGMDSEGIGAERLSPGRYGIRTTRDDEEYGESAPSPPEFVTLRDSGEARGQAPTGVTDQYMRIFRPPSQHIRNARYAEIDPVTNKPDIEWEPKTVPGVSIDAGRGVLSADDTSGSTSQADIRATRPIPISERRQYYFRMRFEMERLSGGRFDMRVAFSDDAGNTVGPSGGYLIGRKSFVTTGLPRGAVWMVQAIGPPGFDFDTEIPDNATHMQFIWRNVGANSAGVSQGRNMLWRASNIALFTGKASARKRVPLDLGLGDRDGKDVPVPDEEDPEQGYPPGGYCRPVSNPTDGAYMADYTRLLYERFEDGEIGAYFSESSQGSNVNVQIREPYALEGNYSVRFWKQATGTATPYHRIYYWDVSSEVSLEASWAATLRFGEMPTALTVPLRITPGDNFEALADVRIGASGSLSLYAANGSSLATIVADNDITPGDLLELEIVVKGVGTLAGSAALVWFKNGQRQPDYELTSLDFRNMSIKYLCWGLFGSDDSSTVRVLFDDVFATIEGRRNQAKVPGDYVEYYGPDGTPKSPENFMTGMRIPVRPNTDYVLSAFVGCEGAPRSRVLKCAVKNAEGETLKELPYLAELAGYQYWRREWIHYHTRGLPDAAYLEFVRNDVGEGLFRAMGFQHERTSSTRPVPTPFTNEVSSEGYLKVRMDLAVPPKTDGEPSHLVWSKPFDKPHTKRWLRRGIVVTHPREEDEGNLSSHQVYVRTADSPDALPDAPWRDNWWTMSAEEQQNRFAEMEVRLATTDVTETPLLTEAAIEIERNYPQLLRGDGSEYPGGVLVEGFEPLSGDRASRKQLELADGSYAFEDYARGESPEMASLSLRCWDKETAEEVHETFFVEDVSVEHLGERYQLRLVGDGQFEGTQEIIDEKLYYSFVAEVNAIVMERGEL